MKRKIVLKAIAAALIVAVASISMAGDSYGWGGGYPDTTPKDQNGKTYDENHTVTFMEWKRIGNLKSTTGNFVGFLAYGDYCSLGTNYDNEAINSSEDFSKQDGWWKMEYKGSDPYVDLDVGVGESFLTKDTMNAPTFIQGYDDGDNCDSRRYAIRLSDGKYVYTSMRQIDHVHRFHICSDPDYLTFISKSDLKKKSESAAKEISDNTFKIFYNRKYKAGMIDSTDTFVDTRDGNKLVAHGDSGWSDASAFKVFRGTEKVYSVIDYDCEVSDILKIEDDFLLKDGYTLTIKEGAIVTVTKGSFFINGTINCEGTLLVQEGAQIVPFSPSDKGGQINLNGGTLIVMPNARAMVGLGKDCLNSKNNATCTCTASNGRQSLIVNHGLLAIGRLELKDKSTIENHKGGRMFLGFNLEKDYVKFAGSDVKFDISTSASSLGLGGLYGSFNPQSTAVIKSYDGGTISYMNPSSTKVNYYSYDANGNETHSYEMPKITDSKGQSGGR